MKRVILGDNLEVLRGLASASVPLFYVDPPFNTGTQRVRRAWGSAEPDKTQLSEFRRVLGKYLRKRLIPTVAS